MDEQKNASNEQQLTDAQVAEINQEEAEEAAEALAEAKSKREIEKLRALPPQRVLTLKQYDTLLSIKEEDLTDADKKRLAWAKLRLPKMTYTGIDYTPSQKKKVKVKRKMTAKSRKANRKK